MVVVLGAAMPVTAATPREFYAGLLRRGVASYEANRYPDAAKQLRLAAFGLVDTIDQYQLAQVYLTVTFEKLGQHDKARDAAHRVIAAERVERKYVGLTIPPAVRTTFETAASRLLNPADVKTLREGTTAPRPATAPAKPAVAAAATPQGTADPVPQAPPQLTPAQTTSQRPASSSSQNTPVPPPEAPKTQAVPAKPAPKPVTTPSKPPVTTAPPIKPPASTTTKTAGSDTDGRGGPAEPARPPVSSVVSAPAPRPLTASEAATRLAAADRELNSSNLSAARRAYRDLLGAPGLDHDTLIRVAEGLYRSRDFAGALNAFDRLGTLRRGEEPYHYYVAVAAYETGDSSRAKKELAAALPYIEITPDVARYRGRIESAQ